ncbi:MAG: thiamine diphosphokinase [Bacillota bacterium]|nr:thiamine diphosphokinase [Bacillota bacterium]
MKKAILFGASKEQNLSYLELLRKQLPEAFVICADGGYETAKNAGFTPKVLAGDLDSYSGQAEDAELLRQPPEKDDTDLKICLDVALERGFTDILIVAASGGRLDHYLSNIFLLEYAAEHGAKAELINAKNRVFLHNGGKMLLRRDEAYRYFSLLPLDYTLSGVTLTGLKYPLRDVTLKRPGVISVSNEPICEEYTAEIKKGRALIILSRD